MCQQLRIVWRHLSKQTNMFILRNQYKIQINDDTNIYLLHTDKQSKNIGGYKLERGCDGMVSLWGDIHYRNFFYQRQVLPIYTVSPLSKAIFLLALSLQSASTRHMIRHRMIHLFCRLCLSVNILWYIYRTEGSVNMVSSIFYAGETRRNIGC